MNLQGKLQKHQAFVLELNANESRIEAINNKGKKLVDADHYAKGSVDSSLEDIDELWKELNLKADEKGKARILLSLILQDLFTIPSFYSQKIFL